MKRPAANGRRWVFKWGMTARGGLRTIECMKASGRMSLLRKGALIQDGKAQRTPDDLRHGMRRLFGRGRGVHAVDRAGSQRADGGAAKAEFTRLRHGGRYRGGAVVL